MCFLAAGITGSVLAWFANSPYHYLMSKTVLVVDDDKLARESLTAALEERGLAVMHAEDGKKGLDLALEKRPNLVIVDVRMPVMDGHEMLQRLREDEWGKNVPAVILSSDESTDSINQALQAGVTVYLSKSTTTADDLAQQVITALG